MSHSSMGVCGSSIASLLLLSLQAAADSTTGGGPLARIAKSGDRIAGAPEHSLAAELRYDHPAGWWSAPQVEWVPKGYHTKYANTAKNPAYAVLHVRAGWSVTEHLSVFAEGRNLTDKTYAGAVVVNDPFLRYANPAIGINGFAGLEWRS